MIIDTHTHFYDPTRGQGIPWPPADNELLYRTVLPAHHRELAQHGVLVRMASPYPFRLVFDPGHAKRRYGHGKSLERKLPTRFDVHKFFRFRIDRLTDQDIAALGLIAQV